VSLVDAQVIWNQDLSFEGSGDGGFPIRIGSPSSPGTGAGPVELIIIALAGCTAMDVISILMKKQERVVAFQVSVHAERETDYPKVITSAELEYTVTGSAIREASLRRAIELSVTKYCPVHVMLSKAFPIGLKYSILEGKRGELGRLVTRGGILAPGTLRESGIR
jgi:putative redox protein